MVVFSSSGHSALCVDHIGYKLMMGQTGNQHTKSCGPRVISYQIPGVWLHMYSFCAEVSITQIVLHPSSQPTDRI
jgi:hypothetical protein